MSTTLLERAEPAAPDRRVPVAVDAPFLAVALHDVQPTSFDRCALIRDWLADMGIARMTLLVIPAPRMKPFFQSSPELAVWLRERRDAGDAIAQHGFVHPRPAPRPEFVGLSRPTAREKLSAGRRLMTWAGLPPSGFVAPGYAATGWLPRELASSYDWWATFTRVRSLVGVGTGFAPVIGLDTSSRWRREMSLAAVELTGRLRTGAVRLDLHPTDFDRPRHVLALERLLDRLSDRAAVTYDELAQRP